MLAAYALMLPMMHLIFIRGMGSVEASGSADFLGNVVWERRAKKSGMDLGVSEKAPTLMTEYGT